MATGLPWPAALTADIRWPEAPPEQLVKAVQETLVEAGVRGGLILTSCNGIHVAVYPDN